MPKINAIYVIGSFPDRMNSNINIREYIAEGMAEAATDIQVIDVSLEKFLSEVEAKQNDICLFVGSVVRPEFPVEPMFWRARKNGARTAIWLHDDPYEFDASPRVVGHVDAIFVSDQASVYHYPEGVPVFHLPLAASRKHALSPPPSRAGYDFFFAGYPYENRVAFFRTFVVSIANRSSMRGVIVGPGWPVAEFSNAIDLRISTDSLLKWYRDCLVTIYLGRQHNFANARFQIQSSTPGPRLFEAAGAGACQVVVGPGLEAMEYFVDGEEMLVADDADQAAEELGRLKLDPQTSLKIGNMARKRVLADHLYFHRAQRILAVMAEL